MGRGLLFKVWFHLITWLTESAVGIKPGGSGVVIGYQVDEFTHTWSTSNHLLFMVLIVAY